ncbi:zinc finger matrin-type protein 5 [Aedes albopictus]|uniref:C3H1-type domain-containing protein n=1 Tax=Aedes albopictus TaxID=7160 RepID=A0ABM1YRV0_AEDAL|nr:zinc finger matrin-type protein 5-like [Aedes albopictus]
MGKKYYCDYCRKHIQRDPSIVRKHNEGVQHIRNRADHYESCKDVTEIMAENARKKPCRTMFTSEQCTFGATCRYSHYTPEQLNQFRRKAQKSDLQRTKRLAEVIGKLESAEEITRKFLEKRSQAKELREGTQFWTYTEDQLGQTDLPPSLQEIDPTRIDASSFTEWG